MFGTFQDITERKQAEEELFEKNQLLDEINNYAQEITFIKPDTLYKHIVKKIKEFTGASAAFISIYDEDTHELVTQASTISDTEHNSIFKFLGKNIIGFRSKVNEKMYKEITSSVIGRLNSLTDVTFGGISPFIGKAIKSVTGYEWFMGIALLHDKSLIGTVILSGKKETKQVDNNEILAFAGITANAISRANAEKALRQSEEKWRSLTENSPNHIMLIDLDFNIQFINFTVPDLTKEEVIGKSSLDFVPPDQQHVAIDCFKKVIKSSKPDGYEIKYITAESETQYFEVRIAPVKDRDARVIGLVSSSHNITKRKQAEKELSKKMNQMEIFNRIAVDRELRMVELKKEINELLKKSGQEKKYN